MAFSSTTRTFLPGGNPLARRRHRRIDPQQVFPELEPAEKPDHILGNASPLSQHFSRVAANVRAQYSAMVADPDTKNPLSRVIVYTLNLLLLLVAFPVGFAMLIVNVVCGGSLKTTLQVLLLTALGFALISGDAGVRMFGLG